jgi:hypothetical protein
MGIFFKKKEDGTEEILLNTEYAFPLMTTTQLESLLVITQLELDKRTGKNTTFRFKSK